MSEPLDLEPIKARMAVLVDRKSATIDQLIEVVGDAADLVIEVKRLQDYVAVLHERLDDGDRRILELQQDANENFVDHQREIAELRKQLADARLSGAG